MVFFTRPFTSVCFCAEEAGGNVEFEKDHITKQIQAGGGKILKKFQSQVTLFKVIQYVVLQVLSKCYQCSALSEKKLYNRIMVLLCKRKITVWKIHTITFQKNCLLPNIVFVGQQVTPGKQCFVIADSFCRTAKYLQALARGYFCVSHRWIRDSCFHVSIRHFSPIY